MILRSPLPIIQYYQNKWLQVKESQYLIPTYNWTLTPIPNWTCSVVTISSFQCTTLNTWLTNCADPNMWLDHQLKKDVGCIVLQFITRWRSWSCLITKPYGVQNIAASSRTRANLVSGHTLLHTCGIVALVQLCVTFYGPLNNPYIYLGLWEKKSQIYTHRLNWNQLWKIKFHKPQ